MLRFTNRSATSAVVAAFIVLSVASAIAGEPIPGVDVNLGKNPGGIVVARTKTDEKGRFVFENLAPGKYLLKVEPKSARDSNSIMQEVSTTRKTIVRNKVEEHELLMVFGTPKGTKPGAPVEIEIGAKLGKISGVITREVPSERSAPKKAAPKK